MTTQIQVRGAAAATQNARILAVRELDVDTTNRRVAVHDGSRAGGYHMANYFDVQNQSFTYIGAAGTNAVTATYYPVPTAYTAGQSFKFKAAATNTGAVTFNVNGLGAKNIYKRDKLTAALVALSAGDLISGGIYTVDYDGTQFQLLADSSTATGGWVKISESSIAGSPATVEFDNLLTDTYNEYVIIGRGVYFDSASMTKLFMRFKRDSQGAYDSGASDYYTLPASGALNYIEGNATATSICALSCNYTGTTYDQRPKMDFQIRIGSARSTTLPATAIADGVAFVNTSGNTARKWQGFGTHSNAYAGSSDGKIKSIQLFPNVGNFQTVTDNKIILYGVSQ